MYELKTVNQLPPGQRLDYFNALVNDAFCPMSCEPSRDFDGEFSAEIQLQQLPRVGLAAIRSSPLDVFRKRSEIAQATDATYLVKVEVNGESLVRQRRREAHLKPGDFVLCLSSEPYELHFSAEYAQLVLAVPQSLMEECVRSPEQHLGVRMDSQVGVNGLFSQFVTLLGARMDTLDGVLAQRLEANVIDLLSTTLGHSQESRRPEALDGSVHGDVKGEYLQRIKGFIRSHLCDENLTPAAVAEHHGISRRYLHMLFAQEGESVSRFILRLRLEACQAALADAAFSTCTVSGIAYRFGFNDASHFSRAFKSQFGETPANFRKQCLAGGTP
jgi:AraC-like DNA-binding protein